jgi:diguanylate cyclase (GGDEF)-like protein
LVTPSEAGAPGLPEAQAAHLVYAAVPIPVCVIDAAGRLVALNPAAEHFWGVRGHDVVGSAAADVLGVRPVQLHPDGADPLGQALAGGSRRVPCRISTRDGLTHSAALVGTPLQDGRYSVLAVVGEQAPPEWALTDPVTGLLNRLAWQREQTHWTARGGAAVLLDLDDLKEINDIYGHRAGDRVLATVGEALRARAPEGSLLLRYGGDEFLALLPEPAAGDVGGFCQAVAADVAAQGAMALGGARRPRLAAGWARFAPGGVDAAVHRADDALYEQKGAVLRAGSGTRLVLTREGQRLLRRSEEPPAPEPAAFASRFTAEFDAQFREALARASEQARRFVAFVDPPHGAAAVEVGAGSGRISFDGGLAQRIGPQGQLLVTDPSAAQLQIAQRRALEAGCPWVRFLTAAAEALPLASGCVDLVVGAVFLHFTDPARALSELARVLRPGGTLALCAPLPFPWPPFMAEVLAPVQEAAERVGLPPRHPFVPEEQIRTALVGAGLEVTRTAYEPDRIAALSMPVAKALFLQVQAVGLMLRGAPPGLVHEVEERVLRRIEALWDAYPPEEREGAFEYLYLVARKP